MPAHGRPLRVLPDPLRDVGRRPHGALPQRLTRRVLQMPILTQRGMGDGTHGDHQFDEAHGDVLRAIGSFSLTILPAILLAKPKSDDITGPDGQGNRIWKNDVAEEGPDGFYRVAPIGLEAVPWTTSRRFSRIWKTHGRETRNGMSCMRYW